MPKYNHSKKRGTHKRQRAIQNTDAKITRSRGSKVGLLGLIFKPKNKAQRRKGK